MLVSKREMSPGSGVVVKSMVGTNSRIWFTLSASPITMAELRESIAVTPQRFLAVCQHVAIGASRSIDSPVIDIRVVEGGEGVVGEGMVVVAFPRVPVGLLYGLSLLMVRARLSTLGSSERRAGETQEDEGAASQPHFDWSTRREQEYAMFWRMRRGNGMIGMGDQGISTYLLSHLGSHLTWGNT